MWMPGGSVTRFAGGLPGLLLAVLALVCQVAIGSAGFSDRAAARERAGRMLDAAAIDCDATLPESRDRQPHAPLPLADQALCPHSADLSLPAVVPAAAVAVMPRTASIGSVAAPFEARGPPGTRFDTPPTRGPPA